MGFQSTVNLYQAPGVEGDFASANPRASVVAPESGFVADTAGVTVGRFAWATGAKVLSSGTGVPTGFVHREQQALITAYLGEASNVIPVGQPVTIMRTGDYYVTSTVAAATVGQKAFAKLTDGTMQPGNAGATISGYIETPFVISRAAGIGELAVITL
jgi:hypothetical protein